MYKYNFLKLLSDVDCRSWFISIFPEHFPPICLWLDNILRIITYLCISSTRKDVLVDVLVKKKFVISFFHGNFPLANLETQLERKIQRSNLDKAIKWSYETSKDIDWSHTMYVQCTEDRKMIWDFWSRWQHRQKWLTSSHNHNKITSKR